MQLIQKCTKKNRYPSIWKTCGQSNFARMFTTVALLLVSGTGFALEYPGVTSAYKSAEIAFSVSGKIQHIKIKEGQKVKKGQDLVQLYSRTETLDTERKLILWRSKAEVDAAKEKAVALKKQLTSMQILFDRGAVSEEELQQKELDYLSAFAMEAQLTTREQVEKIDYQLAHTSLNYRTLSAPFNGVITRMVKELGESVEANQPILKLVDLSRGYFTANLEPTVASNLTNNQTVSIQIKDGIKVTGKVIFISPEIDPASGLLQIKVEYDNAKQKIRPGIAANLIL